MKCNEMNTVMSASQKRLSDFGIVHLFYALLFRQIVASKENPTIRT